MTGLELFAVGAVALLVGLPTGVIGIGGVLVGIGSAMSGTAGPLLLMPVSVWLRVRALAAVGLGQVIHLPITPSASIANPAHDTIEFALVSTMTVPLMAGVPLGTTHAHRLPGGGLRRVVARSPVLVGALVLARTSWTLGHGEG